MSLELDGFYRTALCGQDCTEDIGLHSHILIASSIGGSIHLNLDRSAALCSCFRGLRGWCLFFLLNRLRFLYRKENRLNKISCRNYYYT